MTVKTILPLTVLLVFATQQGLSQGDTLADVFPLQIGNQWTYQYYTYWFFTELGEQWTCQRSGQVTFTVVKAQAWQDSIDWMITYAGDVVASDSFVITEYLVDSHPLRVTGGNRLVDGCGLCFPFGDGIDRFMPVDPATHRAVSGDLTLQQNIGEVRYYVDHEGDPMWKIDNSLSNYDLTSVPERNGSEEPDRLTLLQNYPNPFNPNTVIGYSVAKKGYIRLKVYNLLGEELATLVDGLQDPGDKSVRWDGTGYASGMYYYRLSAGNVTKTKKMILVR